MKLAHIELGKLSVSAANMRHGRKAPTSPTSFPPSVRAARWCRFWCGLGATMATASRSSPGGAAIMPRGPSPTSSVPAA